MSFNAFMKANAKENKELEVIVSDRFVARDQEGNVIIDDEGKEKLVPCKFKGVSQNVADRLKEKSRTSVKDGKVIKSEADNERYTRLMVIESMVEPNLKDKELQTSYGCLGNPEDLLGEMFTQGEYLKLIDGMLKANDLGDIADEYLEAKN